MTNEEKARILSNKGCLDAYISRDAEALNPTEEDRKRLSIYGACLEAMQWKDDRHKQEKQQWIEKAVDFISKCFYIGINNHITSKEDYYSLTELIRDFEQTMKGE